MFNGRILLISDQEEMVETLRPLIQSQGHLALTVSTPAEAMGVLEEGIIPDVVLADDREADADRAVFISHFRRLNRLGQYIVVQGDDVAATRTSGSASDPETIRVPFSADAVGDAIDWAMEQIRRDLQAVRAELFRETARLQEAIRNAQLEMVTALAVTMEAKDPYMRGHCARVSAMAIRIAGKMGVSQEDVERLSTAAIIHEIGKIGISMNLLHRPGTLSESELAQVRQYPKIGSGIVAAIPSLRHLAPLIEHQHEDYERLGERFSEDDPDRILCAILRVADVYDAMTSDRPYRKVLPREKWEAIIRTGIGTEFDPEAVQALFSLLSEDSEKAA